MTTKTDYATILRSFKTDEKEHTHTKIGDKTLQIYGGKFNITDMDKFYDGYYNHIFVKGNKEYLTERQLDNDKGQILIDFDFRYKNNKKRKYNSNHLYKLINIYINVLNDYINLEKYKIYVLEKKNPYFDKDPF